MKNKFNNFLMLVFPFKKINFFVIFLFCFGLILGAFFSTSININDRNIILEKISSFINNINSNSFDSLVSFKNSISINFTYLILILFSGLTVIGVFLNIILLFLKSFTIGFTMSSFIITYSYKGLFLSSLYLIFGQLLNCIVICALTIYNFAFCYKMLLIIFKNKNLEIRKFLKGYLFILLILILVLFLSSFFETILFPMLVKLLINLYV